MGKNIYDMLNEVEIDLSEYEREDFTDIEKRKIKNKFKKSIKKNNSIYKKGIIAASIALLIIGFSVTDFGNHVWANAGTYVNTVAYGIGNFLGIEKDLDEYKTVIEQPITKEGVTIKLNEVILDNNQLIVSTTLKSDEKLEDIFTRYFGSVYINGKSASDGAGGGSKQIDDHTIEEVMTYNLNGDFSGDLNIKLVFSDVMINGNTKKAKYVFNFKTNGDELAKDTKAILLNNTFTLENGQNITLEKYTSNNIGQRIYFSKGSKGTDYDMVLRGHDDLGNKVEFCMSSADANSGIFKLNNIDGNLNENAKTLTLTPYAVKFPKKSGKMSNDFKQVGEAFTIDLSK
ncbi:MAG TPA: DUF4179 domain-containing protein [Clostridiaceae bacterium]|jgi:hypothetical protein|nr:DUF4179 domain-containing protein [Clostridiaceae bacterium]